MEENAWMEVPESENGGKMDPAGGMKKNGNEKKRREGGGRLDGTVGLSQSRGVKRGGGGKIEGRRKVA